MTHMNLFPVSTFVSSLNHRKYSRAGFRKGYALGEEAGWREGFLFGLRKGGQSISFLSDVMNALLLCVWNECRFLLAVRFR